MKQTAVEWLIEQFKEYDFSPRDNTYLIEIPSWILKERIEQAKEMEKEQMSRIYEGLLQNVGTSIKQSDLPTFEQYYNETYVSKDIALQNQLESKVITELSDEEITKLANEHILYNDSKRQWVIEGMKLYREQLKNKL